MKALWACAIICATAIAAYSTQYTYSDTGGTVTLDSTGTILTISGAALASPAGTLSMSCTLAVVAPTPPYSKEWSCTGGSFSLHSNDGSTALTGGFTSGLFTLQYVYVRGVKYYNYALNANIAGALTIRGASRAVLGSVVQNLAQLSSPLDSVNGTIQTGASSRISQIAASAINLRESGLPIMSSCLLRLASLADGSAARWPSSRT